LAQIAKTDVKDIEIRIPESSGQKNYVTEFYAQTVFEFTIWEIVETEPCFESNSRPTLTGSIQY